MPFAAPILLSGVFDEYNRLIIQIGYIVLFAPAFPIASLKYDEAMELAYFGAQVLHPSAMTPCIDDNIPVYVRNIFNP